MTLPDSNPFFFFPAFHFHSLSREFWYRCKHLSSTHACIFCVCAHEKKEGCLLSKPSAWLILIVGGFFPIFWRYAAQMLLFCSSPCVLQHWSCGYLSSSLEIFPDMKAYGVFKSTESLFSLVFLRWAAIKIDNLEWIYSKTCAWAGWSLSMSVLLHWGLKQQRVFDWWARLKSSVWFLSHARKSS